jgi:SAM-dependent methyltransferase
VTCRWCGAPLDAGAQRLTGRIRCAACRVATTDPWPDDAALAAAYGEWYRPQAGRFSGPGDWVLRRSRAQLAVRVDAQAPPGPVLDVGAGDGTLVAALRARGRDAVGLERDPGDAPGVVAGEIADVGTPQAAVVLWHALEHLPDPAGALRDAAYRLAPGGLLVVAVPNAASLQARLFGDRWFGLDVPRHLFHFPAAALTARLRELGLRVTGVSHLRGGQILFGWLHGLVGALPGHVDLYDAIRRPGARRRPLTAPARAAALAAAVLVAPVALAGAALEVLLRRGGTVMVEAVKVG